MNLAEKLLAWFDENGREMPWRHKGGAHPNPYQVWISEIMLQQTTVATVQEYFLKWMQKFPTIESLAKANMDSVLLMWQGLGYYTRARKIYECALVLMKEYQGKLPQNREELLKLPGIGPYSASSILAFAFDKQSAVVDANVIRVIARLKGIETLVDKDIIYPIAFGILPQKRFADYSSAIMDLGAMICKPQEPKCHLCPWNKECKAFQKGNMESIPLLKKMVKKERKENVYIIQNEKGAYFIQKRLEKGLLSGLYEFPWEKEPCPLKWQKIGKVSHTFTHFHLDLTICFTKGSPILKNGIWVQKKDFKNYPFSTLMQKVIKKI